ncbi:hypothetical protein [Candidatus Nitrosarchaeum limnium]|uniref:Uncharacterized protein n=1 Tax=Candidatus Nitrosarchaeum limnium BG20 TaxID=859192 RepID=S2E9U5_9ARCH|nr:hypothetical protein [Candidatus Nitrosarchaeum limnium]EPA06171.1 hypothetical protein BG20_I0810 [Candidatus Nitrosarchaeum limnium BG20]
MTIEKAVAMIQNLRNAELETIKIVGYEDKITKDFSLIAKGKADYLGKILEEIEPETYPCSHPKKWHDISDGQLYCMGCNQNL